MNNYGDLKMNDGGYRGSILSLICLRRLFFPDDTLESLIEESKEKPPPSFALGQLYTLRQELGLSPKFLEDSVEQLEVYTTEVYLRFCNTRDDIPPIYNLPQKEDTLHAILESLNHLASGDLGIDNRWKVTSIELAIILGFFLGDTRVFVFPQQARLNMFMVGTAIARLNFEARHRSPSDIQSELQNNTSANISPGTSRGAASPHLPSSKQENQRPSLATFLASTSSSS